VKRSLLEYLVCFECQRPLQLSEAREVAGEIESGVLRCDACAMRAPVIAGIPRFVPPSLGEEERITALAFGYEWTHFAELTDQYEQQFLDWIAPVSAKEFRGKVVLDGGCGKGRHLVCSARFGAKEVIGFDLSQAVESAYANTRHFPNVHVIQADIHRLPLRRESFDFAYSVGVLHHLPSPRKGFEAILPLVRPGGRVSAWVYGRENNGWIVHLVTPLRRVITARMPLRLLDVLSGLITALCLYPAVKLVYRPVNRFAKPLSRFLFYNDYLAYIARFSFRELHSIVFDHLVAPTAHYLRREEFQSWFVREDLCEPLIAWHNRNSWRGTAVRCSSRD